jgi:hypothetical protein
LLEIAVAGTSFCIEIKTVEVKIVPEKLLTIKREPENEYDVFAIAIYLNSIRIGFVPVELNLVCLCLKDAGKLFFYRVVSLE